MLIWKRLHRIWSNMSTMQGSIWPTICSNVFSMLFVVSRQISSKFEWCNEIIIFALQRLAFVMITGLEMAQIRKHYTVYRGSNWNFALYTSHICYKIALFGTDSCRLHPIEHQHWFWIHQFSTDELKCMPKRKNSPVICAKSVHK